MRKVILQLDRPIRFGRYIGEYVGPFDSIKEAQAWYIIASETCKPMPAVVSHDLFGPDDN